MTRDGVNQKEAAKNVGVNIHNYVTIKRLVSLLLDDPRVTPEDKATVDECLKIIERDRRISGVIEVAAVLLKRYPPRSAAPSTTEVAALASARLRDAADKSTEIIRAVKQGMADYPRDQAQAARSAGMDRSRYSFVRKLIILRDDPNVSLEDRQKLEDVLLTCGESGFYSAGQPLIDRYWVKPDPPNVVNKQRRRFDQTIMAIRESCETTTEMVVPRDLSRIDVERAIAALSRSAELIARLTRRMVDGPLSQEDAED